MGLFRVGSLPCDASYFVDHLRALALAVCDTVACDIRSASADELAAATGERGGDTIYRLDLHAEGAVLEFCSGWSQDLPFLLVAEGLEEGERIFPQHADPERLAFTLIADPIDGTRGLMYGKRSAWALLGVAPPPHHGRRPNLADITVALQAELPTSRAALADVLWAALGEGVQAETHDLRAGTVAPFVPRPSQAETLPCRVCKPQQRRPGTISP